MESRIYDELTKPGKWTYHFFHILSNIRPLVWMIVYLVLIPIFALIYWSLPDTQFRIPEGSGTGYWSWVYYSIVTITTLGFGDYTPDQVWAQSFTAIEVGLGLIVMGLFLNSVGSMKSAIDVQSEIEKQRRAHFMLEQEKLVKRLPSVVRNLKQFLESCRAVTTPDANLSSDGRYNPDFRFQDLSGLFLPAPNSSGGSKIPRISGLIRSASATSLSLDSLESKADLTLWPDLLEDCFSFVANYQMFSTIDFFEGRRIDIERGYKEEDLSKEIADYEGEVSLKALPGNLKPIGELYMFVKETATLAIRLEKEIVASSKSEYKLSEE